MGFKLVDEVLDHAPAELTTPERFLLVLLAKAARDEARTCWPGMDTLANQMGVSERRVRQLLNQLAQHGYEVRVPSGVDKNGMPVFASKGHATVYRLPVFDPAKGEEPCHLSTPERGKNPAAFGDGKGGSSRSQRRKEPVAKAEGVLPPFSHEPSGNHQISRARARTDPSRNGTPTKTASSNRRTTPDLDKIRAALAEVGSKRTDDDWCRKVVKQVLERTTVKYDLTATAVTCIRDTPADFIPGGDYAPQYRKEDHQ